MNAIFASKLFRGSARQEKIRAALANPVNSELVMQLKEYLDITQPDDNAEVLIADDSDDAATSKTADENNESATQEDAAVDTTEDDEPVDSSIDINTASEPDVPTVGKLSDDMNAIKGLLNARDDTDGVVVIKIHGDEMWIHYNDNTNLNTVMEPVISLLYASGYHYLEFNRLARSDNAIVFMCTPQTDGDPHD